MSCESLWKPFRALPHVASSLKFQHYRPHENDPRRQDIYPDWPAMVRNVSIEELGEQLAFYRQMCDRFPKANGSYDAPIEALERLAKELGAAIDGDV